MTEVLLVSMPFFPIQWPPLGLGLLTAAAKRAGLEVKTLHAHLRFARKLGYQRYNLLSSGHDPECLLAEWIFSGTAFKNFDFPHRHYLDHLLHGRSKFAQMVRDAHGNDLSGVKEVLNHYHAMAGK